MAIFCTIIIVCIEAPSYCWVSHPRLFTLWMESSCTEVDSEEEELGISREATHRLDSIRDVLTMSLSRLDRFPVLESVSLTFYPCFSKEVFHPSSYRLYRPTQLQWRLIPAIPELPHLKSLTIRNLIPVERQALYGFRSTFESLESLRITVLGGLGDTDYLYDRYYGMFWQFTMSSVLSSPLPFSATLTSFTLHSGTDVGAHTPVDFSDLDLPALKSVSLKRILFDEDTGVEDFIIRHQSTLRALYLVECRITVDGATQEPLHRWSQIWTRFAEELQTLTALDVQPERDDEDTTLERSSYVRLIEGTGYLYDALKEPVLGEEDDRQALETFAKLVRSRQHGIMSA